MGTIDTLASASRRLPVFPGKAKVGRLIAGTLARGGSNPLVTVEDREASLLLDARSRSESAFVWNGINDYLPGVLSRLLDVYGSTLYDIGANVGRICVPAAVRSARDVRVVAFEPVRANSARLQHNLASNGRSARSTVVEAALSDAAGETTIAVEAAMGAATGNAMLGNDLPWDPHARTEVVRLARLDDLVDELALPSPDVVKIDVEGAEVAVLRGARRTLATSRPVIVGEFNSGLMPTFGTTFLDVLPNMPGGYEVYSFTSDKAVRRTSPRVGLGEVLLVPRERAEELSTALDVRPSTDGETR